MDEKDKIDRAGEKTEPASRDAEELKPEVIRDHVATAVVYDILSERKAERRRRVIKWSLVAFLFIGWGIIQLGSYVGWLGYRFLPGSDAVAVVPIQGPIAMGTPASADAVNPILKKLFGSDNVKGIVLLINSGGGSPSEAERITRLIDQLREESGKPVYAACSGMCASAAYLIALHTDRIYAGRYSWTGSIGAIMKGWDFRAVLDRFEVDQRVFASGPMKDLMNPYKELSPEMEQKLVQLVDKSAESFFDEVRYYRGDALSQDHNLFTGEVWTAEDSLEYGLIDELGTLEEIVEGRFEDLPMKFYVPKKRRNSFFESILSEVAIEVKNELLYPSYEVQM